MCLAREEVAKNEEKEEIAENEKKEKKGEDSGLKLTGFHK